MKKYIMLFVCVFSLLFSACTLDSTSTLSTSSADEQNTATQDTDNIVITEHTPSESTNGKEEITPPGPPPDVYFYSMDDFYHFLTASFGTEEEFHTSLLKGYRTGNIKQTDGQEIASMLQENGILVAKNDVETSDIMIRYIPKERRISFSYHINDIEYFFVYFFPSTLYDPSKNAIFVYEYHVGPYTTNIYVKSSSDCMEGIISLNNAMLAVQINSRNVSLTRSNLFELEKLDFLPAS